jgi:predicted nucleic acid-binding protein
MLVDACVLINLALTDHLNLLGSLSSFEFLVPGEALGEVLRADLRLRVNDALSAGWLQEDSLENPASLALYADLRRALGAGESACIALAAERDGLVASDEKRVFLREARRCLGEGRILNTPGLFLLALRRGLLSVAEADEAKLLLEEHRFRMAFASFQDLLHDTPV